VLIAMSKEPANAKNVDLHKVDKDVEWVADMLQKTNLEQSKTEPQAESASLTDVPKEECSDVHAGTHKGPNEEDDTGKAILVYDPVHTVQHTLFLKKHYQMLTIESNEQCKRKVKDNTLFYMPKCDQQLVANVIEANLDQLSQILIVGNSIKEWLDKTW